MPYNGKGYGKASTRTSPRKAMAMGKAPRMGKNAKPSGVKKGGRKK